MGMIYKPKYTKPDGSRVESAVWWLKYYRNGKPIRESARSTSEAHARRQLKLKEGDVARGVPVTAQTGRVRFEELAQDVLNDYRVNGKRSLDHAERRITKHLKPFFEGRRAAEISTDVVRQFILERQEKGASNGEINRELSLLKRAFNLAMQAGKILHRPHVPMLQENNIRTGFFEPAQYNTVKGLLPEALRPVVAFAYITGWRVKSEVLPLCWRQVDFSNGTVRLDAGTTKNGEGRVFPMTTELRELLEAQWQATKAAEKKRGEIIPWVFHRQGVPIRYFRRSWASACKAAGCPARIPHDFRRTAVRNLVRAGIPERVAMTMTGHKTRSVFERYNIVSEGDLLAAAARLDEVAGKAAGKVEAAAERKGSGGGVN